MLLADGAIRFVLALPLLIVASQTVAAVAIAAAAAGGAVAPLFSRKRGALRRVGGRQARRRIALGSAVRFALPAAVIAGAEQVLVSGGPLLVLIAGGEGAAAAAGVLFAATLLVRAPVFLLQGVQASLLPSLTTFRARGDEASLHRATVKVAVILAGFAAALAAGALVAGPVRDGADVRRRVHRRAHRPRAAVRRHRRLHGRRRLLPGGARPRPGVGGRARLGRSAPSPSWRSSSTLSGTAFHRVSVAFAAGSVIAGLLLMRTLWRERT